MFFLLKIFLLLLISLVLEISQQSLFAQAAFLKKPITAREYATFLNSGASSDALNCYNEKMGEDPLTASIIRTGTPGNYYYEVISGRENFPTSYMTEENTQEYIFWLQDLETEKDVLSPLQHESALENSAERSDFFLASNKIIHHLPVNDTTPTLLSFPNITHSNIAPWIQEAGIGASIALAVLAGRALLRSYGPEERPLIENKATYSTDTVSMYSETMNTEINNRPQKGSFIAGQILRNELAITTKKTMLAGLQQSSNTDLRELEADLGRAQFSIHDTWGFSKMLCTGHSDEDRAQGINKFKNFIGAHHPLLASAISRFMNQTLFADALLMIHQYPRNAQEGNYSTEGLINYLEGIALEVTPTDTISYDLERKKSFLTGRRSAFILKAENNKINPIGSDPAFSLHQSYSFGYIFRLNPHFSEQEPLTLENFPCNVECDHVRLTFSFKKI